MKEELCLVKLDTEYCNYLRKFDDKVPYNYNEKEIRPFVGVLFAIDNCMYFAPLSSPKPKHLRLKAKIDFLKIDNGKLGAINFNNILPVTEKNIIKLDLNKKSVTKSEEKYMILLEKQLHWLNRNSEKLYGRSKKLYEKYLNKTLEKNIYKRCCNFKLLVEKCLLFNSYELQTN